VTDREFYRRVSKDSDRVLDRLVELLASEQIPFCVIGGLAVNAYAEPVVSLDLDIVVAADHIEALVARATADFRVERFAHSINLAASGSALRIQIQLDSRYQAFIVRSSRKAVLGYELPVASAEDVLAGKIWAASDETRRGSKRQKDLADISRLIETDAKLLDRVPTSIREKLLR
jgi:hypothetical protein